MLRKSALFSFFFAISILFASVSASAQCSLCASNVASGVKSTQKKAGLGLNSGIYVLLTMPYVVAGVLGVLWYTNTHPRKRGKINVQH